MQTAAFPLFSQSALAPMGRNKKFAINNLDTQIIYKAVLFGLQDELFTYFLVDKSRRFTQTEPSNYVNNPKSNMQIH